MECRGGASTECLVEWDSVRSFRRERPMCRSKAPPVLHGTLDGIPPKPRLIQPGIPARWDVAAARTERHTGRSLRCGRTVCHLPNPVIVGACLILCSLLSLSGLPGRKRKSRKLPSGEESFLDGCGKIPQPSLNRMRKNYTSGPAATRALPASLPVYLAKFFTKRLARSAALVSQSATLA